MIDYIATFIVFFAIIDPIGTIPVFIAITSHHDEKAKKRVALISIIVSAGVLLFFIIAGEVILNAMAIPLSAFKIAGGFVLFLFALNMIFGDSKPGQELKLVEEDDETAFYPLAIPSIAGPGAMLTAVLLTENSRFSIWQQAQTAAVMLTVLAITYFAMLIAGWINRLLGRGGAIIISRVMGLILSSVAVANILGGLKQYFQI